MKLVFVIAIVAVAMIGVMIPSSFAIHHQSSDTLPESFTVSETPNAPFQLNSTLQSQHTMRVNESVMHVI